MKKIYKYLGEDLFGEHGSLTRDRSLSGQVLLICSAMVLLLIYSMYQT